MLTYASVMTIPGAPHSIDLDDDKENFLPILTAFGAHHLLWLECLQKVEDGEIKRLMGLMPPGSAKSTYSSVVFPTHFLGRFPETSIIVASYASDLPKKFGRRARAMVQQPLYKRIFNTELSAESSAVDEWALMNGSEWKAAGILTGITGHRVDGIVWDDLIKGREQADSDIIRQKTWEAYIDDLQTRRKPTSWEVGITTRWHEDDIAGRILPLNYEGESGWIKGQDGNDWYVLCLPAECDRLDDPLGRKIGDILWPEWFTKEFFAPYKRQARTWSALYQQKPAPETGTYFEADWLRPVGSLPDRDTLSVYGASDYAVAADGNDYTVHIVVGLDPRNHIYVLDIWRAQASSERWIESLCDLIEKWKPLGWAEETGQIRAGIGPFLDKRLRERQLWVVRATFPSRGDKAVRAQSIRGRMAMDGLWVPTSAPWYPEFKKELMAFPAGRRDDQVDALGLIGQVLDKMVAGTRVEKEPENIKIISTDAKTCTVTLEDLWNNEDQKLRRWGHRPLRIQ